MAVTTTSAPDGANACCVTPVASSPYPSPVPPPSPGAPPLAGVPDGPADGSRFLKAYYSGLNINMVAIRALVDQRAQVQARTFLIYDLTDAMIKRWIDRVQKDGYNMYYAPNPVKSGLGKKASKIDVRAINAVYVDLDPQGDADIAHERMRLLALAAELTRSDFSPTYVVDSGGGVQLAWLLRAPQPIDPDTLQAAEAINARLADALGGDHVQNVDRLLRLPGTINYPNERKQSRGRVEAPARLLHEGGQRYEWPDLELMAEKIEKEFYEHRLVRHMPSDKKATQSAACAETNTPPRLHVPDRPVKVDPASDCSSIFDGDLEALWSATLNIARHGDEWLTG